jgi:hypothetical protein
MLRVLNKNSDLLKNMLSATSFNRYSLTRFCDLFGWKISRTFFQIYKRAEFIKVISNYSFILLLFSNSTTVKHNFYFYLHNFFEMYRHYISLFVKRGILVCIFVLNKLILGFISSIILLQNIEFFNIISYLKCMLRLYVRYVHIVYIWLYSIKYARFQPINFGTVKTKTKKIVLLRSPLSDKKSRVSFGLQKKKKSAYYPSFLLNSYFFDVVCSFCLDDVLVKQRLSEVKNG